VDQVKIMNDIAHKVKKRYENLLDDANTFEIAGKKYRKVINQNGEYELKRID
jgi:hypothetical protein